jgi:hypothetical protein
LAAAVTLRFACPVLKRLRAEVFEFNFSAVLSSSPVISRPPDSCSSEAESLPGNVRMWFARPGISTQSACVVVALGISIETRVQKDEAEGF